MPDPKPLNPREQRFVQEIAAGSSETEAYARAGFSTAGNEATIRKEASRIRHRPHVAAAVIDLQGQYAERCEINLGFVSDGLRDAWLRAKADNQIKHEIVALNSLAKLHGLIIDKADLTVRTALDDMKTDDLLRLSAALAGGPGGTEGAGGAATGKPEA